MRIQYTRIKICSIMALLLMVALPSAASVLTGFTLGTFYGGHTLKDLVYSTGGEATAYVELPFNAEVVSSTMNAEGLPYGGMWSTSGSDFDSGTYSDTELMVDHVQLVNSGGFVSSGTYESRVFDAGYVTSWGSVEWWYGYGEEFPNWGASEVHSAHPADMTSNSLLMHFNETAPDTIAGHDFQDTSGNGNHGDEIGGVTFGLPGVFSSSAGFDGSNDAVIIPDSPSISPGSQLSLEAWLYLTGTDTWSRKVPIYLSPATPSADFQVRMEIPYMDGMQPDFDDLRFLDSSGNQLPYWLESYTASTRATVWVRIPDAGTSVIYMYYGNPSASSMSDASSVFLDTIPGLRVAYHFDEGSGTTARDTAYDWALGSCTLYTSDYCDDSALIQGASWTSGRFGSALEFDGVNDWVNLDHNPSEPSYRWNDNPTFDNYITQRTVLVWINPTDASTLRMVYEEGGAVNGLNIYIYGDGNGYVGAWSESPPNNWPGAWLSHPVSLGSWQHLALVFDGGNELDIYYNGARTSSFTPVDNRIDGPHTGNDAIGAVYQDTKLHTGDLSSTLSSYFRGSIDEFLVFDSALTETQVREIYENYAYTTSAMPGTALIVRAPPSSTTVTFGAPTATGISKDGSYGLGASGNKIYGSVTTGDGTFTVEYDLPTAPNGWNHVAMTYDGSQLRLYVNGTQVASTPATGVVVDSDEPLLVGDYIGFSGRVDELALFGRTLTPTEVLEHYARGVTHLSIQVRSCDDPGCVGDPWVSVPYPPPRSISVPDNRYFQFMATFTTQDDSLSPELYRFDVSYGTGGYPSNIWLDVGNDGVREWRFTGPLDHSVTVDDAGSSPSISSQLNRALIGCNCTGCVLAADACRIPLVFHSDTEGILRLSGLSVSYNKLYINVTVKENGEPVSGALVELIRPSGGTEIWAYGYTGPDGRIGFAVTRGWTYDIRVSKPGYGTVMSTNHAPGDDVNVELSVAATTRTKTEYSYLLTTVTRMITKTRTLTKTVFGTMAPPETVTITRTQVHTITAKPSIASTKTVTRTIVREFGPVLVHLSPAGAAFPSGSKAAFVLTLSNSLPRRVEGGIKAWFVDPSGKRVNETSIRLTLDPNDEKKVALSLDLGERAPPGRWRLEAVINIGNATRRFETEFTVFQEGRGLLDLLSFGAGLLVGLLLLVPLLFRRKRRGGFGS